MSLNRKFVVLLITAITLGVILATPSPQLAAQESPKYTAVPSTPVAYDGSKVQVGLQLPDGSWATRNIDQRFPCLGKISATVPIFSTAEVHLTGTEPEWQEVPVEFNDVNQTYTTHILVVPEDWVIDDMQVNTPSTGRTLHLESEKSSPVAVVEYVGTTPLQVNLPTASRQILSILLNMFGHNADLDGLLDQAEVPNIHVRWIPVSGQGPAEFVSPDPNLPTQLKGKLGETEKVRVHIIGAGSHMLVP
jgi:hypothetical protein